MFYDSSFKYFISSTLIYTYLQMYIGNMSFYRISVFTAVVAIFALFSLKYLQIKNTLKFNIRKPSCYYSSLMNKRIRYFIT